MSIASKAGKFFIGAFIFVSGCTFSAAVSNFNRTGEAAPAKAKVEKAKPVKAKAKKRKAPAKVETRRAKVEPFRYAPAKPVDSTPVQAGPIAPANEPQKISVQVNISVDNSAAAI